MADKFDYNKARATADRLISKYGQPADAIKKGATGGFDSGGNVKPDGPDVIINGVVTPLLKYKMAEIDGESIKRTDSYVFFSSETEPEINMQITVNSQTFRIIDKQKLTSVDDIKIYIKVQLRK